MGLLNVLKEEFQWRKLGFGGNDLECFHTFMCRPWRIVYLAYRLIMATYCLTWLCLTAHVIIAAGRPWSIYLTNISYTTLTVYMVTHFLLTLGKFILESRRDTCRYWITRPQHLDASNKDTSPNHGYLVLVPHGVVWITFSVMTVIAPVVTIVFWVTIFPGLSRNGVGLIDLQVHILNSVIMLIEHLVSAVPVRILHAVYPVIYGFAYITFTAVYWSGDHSRVIYPILNWNKPGPTVGYVFIIGLVIVPVLHLIFFGVYKLKVYIYNRVSNNRTFSTSFDLTATNNTNKQQLSI